MMLTVYLVRSIDVVFEVKIVDVAPGLQERSMSEGR